MALFCVTSNLKRARPFMSLLRSRSINTSSSRDVQLKLKTDAQSIFHAALGAVSPQEMVKNNLLFRQNILSIMDHEYVVDKNVSVVAFGKAVLGMTKAVEDVLGDQIVRGVASIPVGLPHAIKVGVDPQLNFFSVGATNSLNPLPPTSEQDRSFPYYINKISSRQTICNKRFIN